MEPYRSTNKKIKDAMSKLKKTKKDSNKEIETIAEEEIMLLVDAGSELGATLETERELIQNIFDWRDMSVSEVMTHRTDMTAIDKTASISEIVRLAIDEGYSRIPVYEENFDKIIGVVNVKDLLRLVGCETPESYTVKDFMREVMFVPETAKCRDVFEEMTRLKTQFAIVSDEYGGTAGVITIEDLIEEIVGNIQDEYDEEEEDFVKDPDGNYTIDGSCDPEDFFAEISSYLAENRPPDLSSGIEKHSDTALKLPITLPEDHEYDTMSAFFTDLLGHIPKENEVCSVNYQGLEFKALVVEDNMVRKILLKIL